MTDDNDDDQNHKDQKTETSDNIINFQQIKNVRESAQFSEAFKEALSFISELDTEESMALTFEQYEGVMLDMHQAINHTYITQDKLLDATQKLIKLRDT